MEENRLDRFAKKKGEISLTGTQTHSQKFQGKQSAETWVGERAACVYKEQERCRPRQKGGERGKSFMLPRKQVD